MFYYTLYNMTVVSCLELPDAEGSEMHPGSKDADVAVTLCSVPQDFLHDDRLAKPTDDMCYLVSDPQLFYMRYFGFDFEVSNGCLIKVDIQGKDVTDTKLTTFILGSAFGVIGMQRGFIPIHGTAIVTGNDACIITGFVGSGKSAILGSLINKGFKYLADDVSMIVVDNGNPYVLPSYPQRKIAASTAEEIRECVSGAVSLVESGKEKLAIRRTFEWLDKKLPLSCIVELVPEARENEPGFTPEVRRITGHASLKLVLRNQYRPHFVAKIGTPPERMKRLLDITSSVNTFQLIRPVTGFPVGETAQIIIDKCFPE